MAGPPSSVRPDRSSLPAHLSITCAPSRSIRWVRRSAESRCPPSQSRACRCGFTLNGDTIHARFAIRSTNMRWTRDSGFTNSTVGDLIWRTVSGISNLDVEARLSGALHHPDLAVRSNLDQAIASRLRAVLGEQVAAAEKQVRDRVDALINDKVGPVRARVNDVQTQAQAQVAQQRARLDELQKQLEQRLRELTRIRLP